MKATIRFLPIAPMFLALFVLLSACGVAGTGMPESGLADTYEAEEGTAFLMSSASSSVESPSDISYDARVSYDVTAGKIVHTDGAETTPAKVTFKLEGAAVGQSVTFDYAAVSGSMEDKDFALPEGSHTITLTASAEKPEPTAEVEIKINKFVDMKASSDSYDKNACWAGEHIFFLHCSNIKNALFTGDKESLTIPVEVESEFDYQTAYDDAVAERLLDFDSIGGVTNGEHVLNGYNMLQLDAEISDAVRKMLDAGVFTHLVLPDGYFTATGEMQAYYNVYSDSDITFSDHIPKLGAALSVSGDSSAPFYTTVLNEPAQDDARAQKVSATELFLTEYPYNNAIRIEYRLTDYRKQGSDKPGQLPVTVHFYNEGKGFEPEQLYFSDESAPQVETNGVYAQSTLKHGDDVPITIEFTEPVYVKDISCRINGATYKPLESEREGTISQKVCFLYKWNSSDVNSDGKLALNVTSISGAKDLSGKSMSADNTNYPVAPEIAFDFLRTFSSCAQSKVVLTQGRKESMTVDISVSLLADEKLQTELDKGYDLIAKVFSSENEAAVSERTLKMNKDAAGNITEFTDSFEAPVNNTGKDIAYGLDFYLKDTADNELLVYPLCTTYTVPPIICVGEGDIELDYGSWPKSDSIAINEGGSLALDYILKVDPTWKDKEFFSWSSSDTTVAEIDSNGVILLKSQGKVTFTLTVTSPKQTSVTLTSKELTVTAETAKYLYVPNAYNRQEVLLDSSTTVYFSSSLKAAEYTFTLYETDGMKIIKTETLTSTETAPLSFYTVPANLLTKTTASGTYGYTLEISAEGMSATASIRVRQKPASVALVCPEKQFLLAGSASSFPVKYSIENMDIGMEAQLTVTKNALTTPIYSADVKSGSGEVNVPVSAVAASLRDTYTVCLKAKNPDDAAWSTDTFCVFVYKDPVQITINGSSNNSYTVNYGDLAVKAKVEAMSISEIRSRLLTAADMPVRLQGRLWNAGSDYVIWTAAGNGISLWHEDRIVGDAKAEGSYNPQLSPESVLSLKSVSAGSTTITAEHTLTGAKDSVTVTLPDIRNKLYLFRLSQKEVPCKLSYEYTEDGVNKTGSIDSKDGEAVLYLESGEISANSKIVVTPLNAADKSKYVPCVIDYAALTATQTSSSELELYPVHTIKLREYNTDVRLEIYDAATGAPYNGSVIIRGGMYQENEYSATNINGNPGTADQTVTVVNGICKLELDLGSGFDNAKGVEFVIELSFPDDKYLPQYVTVNNFEITAGVSDSAISKVVKVTPVSSSSLQNGAVVLSYELVNYRNKEHFPIEEAFVADSSFPLNDYVSMFLDLTVMLPSSSNYRLLLRDSSGNKLSFPLSPLDEGKSSDKAYPFARKQSRQFLVPVAYLMEYVLNNSKAGETVLTYPGLRALDGSSEIRLSTPIKVINMAGVTDMVKSLTGTNGEFTKITDDLYDMAYGEKVDINKGGGGFVYEALSTLKGRKLGSSKISLEISETEDPLVYTGVIRFAVGSYSKDNPSGIFIKGDKNEEFKFLPELSDLKAMSKGTFLQKAKESYNESYSGTKKTYGGGAYVECLVYYDTEAGKWKIDTLYQDLYFGAGLTKERDYNSTVAGIPVTSTAILYGYVESGCEIIDMMRRDTTAYIPRVNGTIGLYAFGGIGFDYKVVALKVGVYGDVYHSQSYYWYSDTKGKKMDGQNIYFGGSTGVEYKAQFLFFSKNGKHELAKFSVFDKDYGEYSEIRTIILVEILKRRNMYGLSNGIQPLDEIEEPISVFVEETTFEDRAYLTDFERSRGGASLDASTVRLLSVPITNNIWTGYYPYAIPQLSADGKRLAYLSDMNNKTEPKTELVFLDKPSVGEFNATTENKLDSSDESNLNSQLSFAGDSAAWVRAFTSAGSAGSTATDEDIANGFAAAEIMAAVKKEEGGFEVTRLTSNRTPDLAPTTAAAGDKAITAWRSVTLGDPENIFDFKNDYIMYSLHNGSTWSEAKCLYDGSADEINMLNTAMLPDGSSAVVYQVTKADIDTTSAPSTDYKNSEGLEGAEAETQNAAATEIFCTVLDKNGNVKNTLRLTDNRTADENPQIAAVELDSEKRFVIGWNGRTESDEAALRLVAVNGDGTLYSDFSAELSEANTSYTDFRFTKGAQKLEELAAVWSEMTYTAPESAGKDGSRVYSVFGTRFVKSGSTYCGTAKQKLLELEEGRSIDHLDACVDSATGKLELSMMLSEKDGSSTLATASAVFENKLTVKAPSYEYEELIPGHELPVQFTVRNDGLETIDTISIVLGGVNKSFTEQALAPDEEKTYLVFYLVPTTGVDDVDYTVVSDYPTVSGTLKLGLPDVGISGAKAVKQSGRERIYRVLLESSSYAKLDSDIHTVELQLWGSSYFEEDKALETMTLTPEQVAALRDGSLSLDMAINEELLKKLLDESGELPKGGAVLLLRTVLKENNTQLDDADISNDISVIIIQSIAEMTGTEVSLASVSETADGKTSVQVEAFNNSMKTIENGNIIARLKDENGTILETKQTYDSSSASLLSIRGEEQTVKTLSFSRAGYEVDISFEHVSSNSGGSSGGDPALPSQSELTVGGVKQNVNVSVSGGKVTASLGKTANEIFKGDSEATLSIPATEGARKYSLELSADALSGENTGASLTVNTELGSVTLPAGMLSDTPDVAGKTVSIDIERADASKLPENVKAAIGGRPVISLTLTADGKELSWSNSDTPVTVSLPYTPTAQELEDPESIVIWFIDGEGKAVCVPNGRYDPVTKAVSFTTTHFSTYAVAVNSVSFGDVDDAAWYAGAVRFIAAREITKGTGDGRFSPDAALTRGQFIVLLMRAYELAPDDDPQSNFSDAGSTYYTGYLAAAKRLGISGGVGNNMFAPEKTVTRQEMFTLLYNTLEAVGQLPREDTGGRRLSDFSDSAQIADWANKAMERLVRAGIVNGDGERLDPAAVTNRAQTAQVLYNLMSK